MSHKVSRRTFLKTTEGGDYQVYAYRLADGTTTRLSPRDNSSDQFADFEGLPK